MSDHIKYDTPLLKKIGFKSGQQVLISGAPEMIVQMLTTESIHFDTSIQTRKSYDLVWLYTNKTAELEDFKKGGKEGGEKGGRKKRGREFKEKQTHYSIQWNDLGLLA
ncbi:MAG: hypothetical protein IPP42_05430 [Saprospiraceae bacterium]|nr:hypothetical protein [Saprospiraceae bacterium]